MMFVQLDNFFRSASGLGALILIITTCVLIVYLVINMTAIIEHLFHKKMDQETVTVNNKESHINVGNRSYEIHPHKIRSLFWKLILISYGIGIAMGFAIIIVIPLVLIGILFIRKHFKLGTIFKGVRQVLKLASPK